MNVLRSKFRVAAPLQRVVRRNLGGGHDHGHSAGGHGHGHGHHEPHVPEFYGKLGKFCLVSTYLWFFYRLKQDNGQLFGLYQPWLHEHHHEHLHFVDNGAGEIPQLEEHDDEEEDEDH